MQDLTSRKQRLESDLINFRRNEALKMLGSGSTLTEIAEKFQVNVSTISRDIEFLRRKARENQGLYIEEELPFQHKLAVATLDKVLEEAWQIFRTEKSAKARLSALDIISDTIMKKQSLLGDPVQIQRAIRVVAEVRKRAGQAFPQSADKKGAQS